MKYEFLQPGDTFRVKDDNRLYMRLVNARCVILHCPANETTGYLMRFSDDDEVIHCGNTQKDYSD